MKKADEILSCYGKFSNGTTCPSCEYCDSCRYYTASARGIDRNLGFASIELVKEHVLSLADPCLPPGVFPPDPGPEPRFGIQEIAAFLHYLMGLDGYTLDILRELIVPGSGREPTVAELSRMRGISRQAMHRKLLRLSISHPELGTLLHTVLGKLSSGRRTLREPL